MDVLTSRKWIALSLVAVVLPVSLLAALRLTGILPEPLTPETITLETVGWEMERASERVCIDQWVKNSYIDGVASADFAVHVYQYEENSVFWDGFDGVELMLFANVTVLEGSVISVVVNFTNVDGYAAVDISEDPDPWSRELVNLKLVSIRDWDCTFGKDSKITTVSIDNPRHVYLYFLVRWMFADQNNIDHWVDMILQFTYFNGTAYRKIISPIQLGVLV